MGSAGVVMGSAGLVCVWSDMHMVSNSDLVDHLP